MTAIQPNAQAFNPNGLTMTRVATYDRLIEAPLERVWENVLDWEHLPHLHETSFGFVELAEAGDWGWRTWSDPDHRDHVELTLATEDSYVARSYQAGEQVSEIWTTLTPKGDATDVHVEFHIPGIEVSQAGKLGELMTGLYTRLWDEDEDMMRERHRRLFESRADSTEQLLGQEQPILAQVRTGERVSFQLKRREYYLAENRGELVAYPSICPHLLGPLADAGEGRLRCPWHGYEFDAATGDCVKPEQATCRLPATPQISSDNGNIIARFTS